MSQSEIVRRLRPWLIAVGCFSILAGMRSSEARSGNSTPCASDLRHCAPEGCPFSNDSHAAYDPDLNTRKNRDFGPPAPNPLPVTPAIMMDRSRLPVFGDENDGKDVRSGWKDKPRYADITTFEARQARLTGYIARVLRGSPETCNCGLTGRDVADDTHLNIVQNPVPSSVDPRTIAGESVIAEVTWHVRNGHHDDWTVANLERLSIKYEGARVRVTGDLLYDNLHWDMVRKKQRGTLWEIHPIRRIEVLVKSKWVDFNTGGNSTFNFVLGPYVKRAPNGLLLEHGVSPFTATWRPRWTPEQIRRFESGFVEDES